MRHRGLLVFALLFLSCVKSNTVRAIEPTQPILELWENPQQLILVVTKNWQDIRGDLQRYERVEGAWKKVGPQIQTIIGRTGLAWGRGLHNDTPIQGPTKREGDGKSPAGVFKLTAAFGYDSASVNNWIKLPYFHSVPSLECVDDSQSQFYNQIVDRKAVTPDWNSSEKMLMTSDAYKYGVVVDHNPNPSTPKGGSCIFLHIWGGANSSGTAGCTSMTEAHMVDVARWIDPALNPIIVQLTQDGYKAAKKPWALP